MLAVTRRKTSLERAGLQRMTMGGWAQGAVAKEQLTIMSRLIW